VQLVYSSAENTTIICTLQDGEILGNCAGPGTIYVPIDNSNTEYQAILESGQPIDPYVPPPVPEPEPVSLPNVMPTEPQQAAPKAYVDTEIAALAARLEVLEARLG